ncbi:hypothetical protein JQ616_22275 [Bradyrhizobium tropiciagri]|uniref:hypothetical protein n=1 Tax=Bradyrhizobium tropiciagri TaxID=312253 RepID=UPI001BAD4AA3|nr:hypothetical protein [Bradyrhizobium tropiciagri]MBR0897687.1 hypothetical protein [Bradyrhizobium tropiciagri]
MGDTIALERRGRTSCVMRTRSCCSDNTNFCNDFNQRKPLKMSEWLLKALVHFETSNLNGDWFLDQLSAIGDRAKADARAMELKGSFEAERTLSIPIIGASR